MNTIWSVLTLSLIAILLISLATMLVGKYVSQRVPADERGVRCICHHWSKWGDKQAGAWGATQTRNCLRCNRIDRRSV